MIRTECRILVGYNENRLEDAVNRLLADGWAITHMSTTAVQADVAAADHYITIILERALRAKEDEEARA
jgi:hypothetical protein